MPVWIGPTYEGNGEMHRTEKMCVSRKFCSGRFSCWNCMLASGRACVVGNSHTHPLKKLSAVTFIPMYGSLFYKPPTPKNFSLCHLKETLVNKPVIPKCSFPTYSLNVTLFCCLFLFSSYAKVCGIISYIKGNGTMGTLECKESWIWPKSLALLPPAMNLVPYVICRDSSWKQNIPLLQTPTGTLQYEKKLL